MKPNLTSVDTAIVNVVLPQAYKLLDTLLTANTAGRSLTKEEVTTVRKLLPKGYTNSFSK